MDNIKTFGRDSFTCIDRSTICLNGIQYFTDNKNYTVIIHPNSYADFKKLIGEWHWENWVFDGGDTIKIYQDEIFSLEKEVI